MFIYIPIYLHTEVVEGWGWEKGRSDSLKDVSLDVAQ